MSLRHPRITGPRERKMDCVFVEGTTASPAKHLSHPSERRPGCKYRRPGDVDATVPRRKTGLNGKFAPKDEYRGVRKYLRGGPIVSNQLLMISVTCRCSVNGMSCAFRLARPSGRRVTWLKPARTPPRSRP